MNQTARILLLAGTAVAVGILINLLLVFLFRNRQFLQGIQVIQKFARKARNPWQDQTQAHHTLRRAVEDLEHDRTAHHSEAGQKDGSIEASS